MTWVHQAIYTSLRMPYCRLSQWRRYMMRRVGNGRRTSLLSNSFPTVIVMMSPADLSRRVFILNASCQWRRKATVLNWAIPGDAAAVYFVVFHRPRSLAVSVGKQINKERPLPTGRCRGGSRIENDQLMKVSVSWYSKLAIYIVASSARGIVVEVCRRIVVEEKEGLPASWLRRGYVAYGAATRAAAVCEKWHAQAGDGLWLVGGGCSACADTVRVSGRPAELTSRMKRSMACAHRRHLPAWLCRPASCSYGGENINHHRRAMAVTVIARNATTLDERACGALLRHGSTSSFSAPRDCR